jgi:Cys-tRNA(Pro)/Cys-tRNA(Cys) deacylase
VPHTVHAFEHAPAAGGATAFGRQAAEALGADPRRVFKTLVAVVDGALTVAVVPTDAQLDLKALAAGVGGKHAAMAEAAQAERATGYVVGGISPLGQRRSLPTLIDDSALGFSTILVSAGRRGLDVELSPADLLRVSGGSVARIARR